MQVAESAPRAAAAAATCLVNRLICGRERDSSPLLGQSGGALPQVDSRTAALFALRQCLQNQVHGTRLCGGGPQGDVRSLGAEQKAGRDAPSPVPLAMRLLVVEMPAWEGAVRQAAEPEAAGRADGAPKDLHEVPLCVVRLLLLLDILEASAAQASTELAWDITFHEASCAVGPTHLNLGVKLLKLCLDGLAVVLRSVNISLPGRLAFPQTTKSWLHLLHILTKHSKTCAAAVDLQHGSSHGNKVSLLGSLIELLSFASCTCGESSGAESVILDPACGRMILGILSNMASQSVEARRSIAGFHVRPGFGDVLLLGGLARPGPKPAASTSQCAGDDCPCQATTFFDALVHAFTTLYYRLDGDEGARGRQSPSDAESRTNCAVAAVLVGWLIHDDPQAYNKVISIMGRSEALVDIVRQFVVFQDMCGVLTDEALVSLHAVMLSIDAHTTRPVAVDDPRSRGENLPCGVQVARQDAISYQGAQVPTPAAENTSLLSESNDAEPCFTGDNTATFNRPDAGSIRCSRRRLVVI